MQILLLLVLTVALYFGAAFAGELIESQRIATQVTSLNLTIGQLKARNVQLTAAVAEAKTDTFVEQQARDKLGMVKPGDNPVIITNTPPPPPPPAPAAAPPTPTHWQQWASLFEH